MNRFSFCPTQIAMIFLQIFYLSEDNEWKMCKKLSLLFFFAQTKTDGSCVVSRANTKIASNALLLGWGRRIEKV